VATRRAAVAGQWYPDAPALLSAHVDRHIGLADVEPLPRRPRAIVAPHAGLMYSGPVAAYSYKVARGHGYSVIVLVGPSHFVPFGGVSLWPAGEWESPFGPVVVHDELAAAVAAHSSEIADRPEAHRREHSLEMQLPFVGHLFPGTPIVPMVVGHQTRQTAFALGDALARALAAFTGEALLVASSDLSHYEDAGTASALDAVVATHVEALDPEGLMAALERDPRHACGGGPMVAVLHAARQLGAGSASVLRYADSGDVSGDKSSVVGYMAAAAY
jgi:MEMO1 family protein